ncbi:MAG: 16S rRNA (guanine(527)-N(7))-methyltransferase RsmG [Flavobacteriales bacterium]|nr:16S rRNA (guanine(527)-N(7))-methyltransferase RsmG [Flavobacteriales bacterium]
MNSIVPDDIAVISAAFPKLTDAQKEAFGQLRQLYETWNAQINVISRKDMDHFYERHVLHSLAIYRFCAFQPGTQVIDIGTGGGFPGIPLAIMLPETQFFLVDSIGKKIKVVAAVAESLGLKNVLTHHGRSEEVKGKFHFAISRAVAPLPDLVKWCRTQIDGKSFNAIPNGLICLKGGDLAAELAACRGSEAFPVSSWFDQEFFKEKMVVYVPLR